MIDSARVAYFNEKFNEGKDRRRDKSLVCHALYIIILILDLSVSGLRILILDLSVSGLQSTLRPPFYRKTGNCIHSVVSRNVTQHCVGISLLMRPVKYS